MYQFQQKLKYLKAQIKKLNQEIFGNSFKEQQNLNKEMEELQQQIITKGHTIWTLEQEQRINTQLEERRKREEILWRKKSRIRCLKEGEGIPNSSIEPLSKDECTTTSHSYRIRKGQDWKSMKK